METGRGKLRTSSTNLVRTVRLSPTSSPRVAIFVDCDFLDSRLLRNDFVFNDDDDLTADADEITFGAGPLDDC